MSYVHFRIQITQRVIGKGGEMDYGIKAFQFLTSHVTNVRIETWITFRRLDQIAVKVIIGIEPGDWVSQVP